MRAKLWTACTAVLFLCNSAFADVISYTETFDGTGNPNWGTDYGTWSELFGSNYSGDGARHSQTGGYTGGYGYTDQDWLLGRWYLIFADSDASGGNLAGDKDYTGTPSFQCYLQRSATNDPQVTFFFVSEASGTTPSNSSTLWYYNDSWSATTSGWDFASADLSSGANWTAKIPIGEGTPRSWTDSIGDVDIVGIMFIDSDESGNPEIRVDNFAATPEPTVLLMMGPMSAFLGWRVYRRRKGALSSGMAQR